MKWALKKKVMKKAMKVTLMIALMFVTTLSMAKDLKVIANSNEKSLVFEMEPYAQATYIRVVDGEERIIYSERMVSGDVLIKKINLSKLPVGVYTVEVEDALKRVNYTLLLEASKVTITDRKEDNKPVFRKEGDRIFINLLNLDLHTVEITVYDSTGRKLFSESSEGAQIVQKAFNFENAYSDSYTVMVRDMESAYYEEIIVK